MAAPVTEIFYDPIGLAFDEGRYISPIGGHSDHVHVSFGQPAAAIEVIAKAQQMGLRVSENPFVGSVAPGVHTGSSYHYKTFSGLYDGKRLGQAVDVTGSGAGLEAFARWVDRTFAGAGAGQGSSTGPSSGSSSPAVAGAGCGTVLAGAVLFAAVVQVVVHLIGTAG